jgi:hypothetical protein
MAENTTNSKIKTTVELDVNAAQIAIVKLNSAAADSTNTLADRLDAKNKQIKIQNDLNKKAISDLEKTVKSLTGVVGAEDKLEKATLKLNKAKLDEVKVNEKNSVTQGKLSDAYKKSETAIGSLDNATGGMITRLKLLAANPVLLFVTLLVGGLTLLKEAFTSSEEGENKFAKATAVVNVLLGNLMDLVATLAETLVEAFENPQKALNDFTTLIKDNLINRFEGLIELIPKLGKAIGLLFDGDFSGAGKVAADAVGKVVLGMDSVTDSIGRAKDAFGNYVDEQKKEAGAAARVADMRAKADKIERALIVERSKTDARIAELRLKAREEDRFSAEERKAALIEARRLGEGLLVQETTYLSLRRDAQILENTFSRSNKENLTKEANAIAAVNNVIAEKATLQKAILKEVIRVDNEIERDAKAKKAADEAEKKRLTEEAEKDRLRKISEQEIDFKSQETIDTLDLERRRAAGENVLALELELLERRRVQDVSAEGLRTSEINAINAEAADAKSKLGSKELQAEEAKNKAAFEDNVATAAESFGIAQEVAVAKMIMNAPEAIGNSFTQAAKAYTPPVSLIMGAAGAAGVIIPIIKGLNDIKNTRFSKQKGGAKGGNISTAAVSAGKAGIPALKTIASSVVTDTSANNASRLGTDSSISSRAVTSALNNTSMKSGGKGDVVFSEGKYNQFQDQVKFKENLSTLGG